MWRACSGAGVRLARAHVSRAVVRLFSHDCAGAVHISELDVEVAHQGLAELLAEARVCPQNVARAGLFDGKHRDGAALGFVRAQQRGWSFASQDARELPSQVMDVLNARVAAETAGRRHYMCGVPGDEYAIGLQPLGDLGGGFPMHDAVDRYRNVCRSERTDHEVERAVWRQ